MRVHTKFIPTVLMFCLSVFFLIGCKKSGAATNGNKTFRVVGYLMVDRADALEAASGIDFSGLTHLNLAFINPAADGSFAIDDKVKQVVSLAHTRHVKVLMSIGGGNIPAYLTSFLRDDKRAAFIQHIADAMNSYGFDGVDVDLEGDAVDANYSKFVTGLATVLKAQDKLITTAIATWFGDNVKDSALAVYDFINVMSYDKTGPWQPNKPGPHAPYSMAVGDIGYWGTTRGIAKEKLNLGVPFYGYGFGTGNTTSTMGFGDIVAAYPGAENQDEVKLHNGQTMYYNGIPTMKNKTTFALQKTGGIMIWELSQDATGNLSLLKNINNVIKGN